MRESDIIEIIGASENNLKHIDMTIPKGKLVVFAGVSGSGGSMAYSFNHPGGMCPDCTGIGEQPVYWQQNPLLDPNKKLRDFTEEEWHTRV